MQDGTGSYCRQHNLGAPAGFTHPAAQLHQVEIAAREVAGVGEILQPQFGEWY